MKKFSLNRKRFEFEYEFRDKTTAQFGYSEPTTEMIDAAIDPQNAADGTQQAKQVLKECLDSPSEGMVEKLIEEQTKYANIYRFKISLDEELGKLIDKA